MKNACANQSKSLQKVPTLGSRPNPQGLLNFFRFDEFFLWLNSSYSNGSGITPGGAHSVAGNPTWPTAFPGQLSHSCLWHCALQKSQKKNMFPSTDCVCLAALVHLYVYRRQGTSLKQVRETCIFLTETHTPYSFSCRLLLVVTYQ